MEFAKQSILAICFIATLTQSAAAQCKSCQQQNVGPGTEMTQMINRLGLGSDCSRCKALADQMDRCGPEWVLANFDHVASRTISNARNLGHRMGPVRRMGVRMLVRTAIRRTR